MHGIAGVDEEIAGGMLDENASGGHGEGKAGEGAASFNPAGGEALERVDRGRHAGVRRSSGQRVAVEIKEVGAYAKENGQEHKQDCGATQPHTDTSHDQGSPRISLFAP